MHAPGDEAGQFLIDALVAFTLFAIVLSVSLTAVLVISKDSSQAENNGQTAEAAQTAVSVVDHYLSNVVSPRTAVLASASSPITLTATSPCWGAAPTGSSEPLQPELTSPSRAGILRAHDFDAVFCAYAPGLTSTHVYEIDVRSGSCSNATTGYCTLQVVDFGSTCNPNYAVSPTNCDNGGPACVTGNVILATNCGSVLTTGNTSGGTVVGTVNNVWCDTYCQPCPVTGSCTAAGSAQPPGGGVGFNRACLDVQGNTQSTCADQTPPFLTYFKTSPGEYSGSGTDLTQSLNYYEENTETTTLRAQSPSTCSTTAYFLDLEQNGGPSGCVASDDFPDLSAISQIALNVTVLGNTALSAAPSGRSGYHVNDEVVLTSQASAAYGCTETAIESMGAPTVYYPLQDGNSVIHDLSGNSNTATGSANGLGYQAEAGPPSVCPFGVGNVLAMNTSGSTPAPSAAGYVSLPASSSLLPKDPTTGTALTVEAWVDASSWKNTWGSGSTASNPRIVANDYTNSDGAGFQLEVQDGGTGGFFDVGAAGGTGVACWGTVSSVPGCNFSMSLSTGTWYFLVGTYNGAGGTVQMYINGVPVGETGGTSGAIKAASTTVCPPPVSTTCVAIGWNPNYQGDEFDGAVTNVVIYPAALSASQVLMQYYEMTQ